MTRSSPPSLESLDPGQLLLLAALVAFHGPVRLAERYLPEYLRALGFGPVVVGALGTLALAVALVVRSVDASGAGRIATAAATALAVLGLLSWAGAPSLDALLGVPLSAIGWLLLGTVLLGPWHARGPGAALSLGDGGFSLARSSSIGDRDGGDECDERSGRDDRDTDRNVPDGADRPREPGRRSVVVASAVGIAGASVLSTAAFAGADTVRAGFALLVAAGAAAGLVAAITVALERGSSPVSIPDAAGARGAPGATAGGESLPSLAAVRTGFESIAPDARFRILGDALARFAVAMTAPFLVLAVVDYHAVALSVGPVVLPPAAVFGVLVLAETAGAVAGTVAAPALETRADRRWLLVGGVGVLAVLPTALVAAPPDAGVLALVFALWGARTALRPVRPTIGEERAAVRAPESVRTAVRVALVPAPLVGGVLYAIGPATAFSLATTVGLLGVRELLRTLR